MGRSAFSLRASIGIALYPAHGLDAETLLRHAETAKYAAVASRRDYLVYEPSLDDARTEASRLIAEFHGALYNEGLGDDYQPHLPLREGLPRRLRLQIGRAHVRTPAPNAPLVCPLLLYQ